MRRRAKQARLAAEQQAQAAMAVAAEHADAGWHALVAADGASWAPPGAAPVASAPVAPAPVATDPPAQVQTDFLRVLEVVTRMCDHVIEYIEADRAERQLLVETLAQMVHTLSALSAPAAVPEPAPAPAVSPPRERVIGGSMPAGPEPASFGRETDPLIDLRESEPILHGHRHEPEIFIDLTLPEPEPETEPGPSGRTAVEVRCRFGEGERWVGGFEIVDVLSTDDAWKYRLRRQRDGAILPQLFDAASIRHIETFEELVNPDDKRWSRL